MTDERERRFFAWWNEKWPDLAPTHQALHAWLAACQADSPAPEKLAAAARKIAMIYVDQKLPGRAYAEEEKAILRILTDTLGDHDE